jgi:putative toxin-antitoxin system antitoxin component (TIGR02293 family)
MAKAVNASQKRAGAAASSQKKAQPSARLQKSKPLLHPVKAAQAQNLTAVLSTSNKASKQRGKHKDPFETSISYWLGNSFTSKMGSDFDVIEIGREGITKASIDDLTTHMGITRKTMAEDVLGMSVKTLERKTPKEKLDKQASSHAIEIAKVMQHAYDVFGDEEKVKRWMNKENRALNHLKPVMILGTLTGINMVNDILGRIQEGVYS